MPSSVSLNDVARMLSTKGDISTIGGAIGCMSAMIGADAREKDNTMSNDVKKLKEFVCGSGGDLSSMFAYLGSVITQQTIEIEKLAEGNKEKKLVKDDITKTIKKATDGLEKRLDKIIDNLNVIAKSQGGNIKWGNTKKVKDSVDKFKDSLEKGKKVKDTKIGKLLETLDKLKAINLKDLSLFKPKMKVLEKLAPQVDKFGKSINLKNLSKANEFIDKLPKTLKDLALSVKISKLIKDNDLKRLYKLLGVNGKKIPSNSILGLVEKFSKIKPNMLKKARENASALFGVVKDICLGVTMLVAFTPVIVVGGLLSRPLEWALFGLKGNGGLMRLMKKLAKDKKTIRKANESIIMMSIGFAALGAGLGIFYALTKKVDFVDIVVAAGSILVLFGLTKIMGKKKKEMRDGAESMLWMSGGIAALGAGLGLLFHFTKDVDLIQLALVAVSTAAFAGITILMGRVKEPIKDGALAMVYMAAGIGALGLGLGILFSLTKNVEWEQMVRIGVVTAAFAGITGVMGLFNKQIKQGALAMVYMAAGIGILGIGISVLFHLTKNIEWEQMLMVGVAVVGLGAATVALGALNKTGMVFEGAIAMGAMGVALIPFGIAMKLLMSSVKGMKWSEFGMFAAATLTLGGAVIGLGALMMTGVGAIAWVAGLGAMAGLGAALIPFGIGMKMVNKVAKDIDNKSIEKLGDTTKSLMSALNDAADKKTRKNARKNARTLKTVGRSLHKIAKSLKTFNEVAPDSIDKAVDSLRKISNFFFGEGDGTMSAYSTNWGKRRKVKKEADTIAMISGCMYRLAYGLKTFNEVAPDSITKAMNAVQKIADYFFQPKSLLNSLFRNSAKKNADAIGKISDCVYKLAKGLKDFNEVAPDSITKAMDSIQKIADYFFDPKSMLNMVFKGAAKKKARTIGVIADSMYKVAQALKDFNQVGPQATATMIDSVNKISDTFFVKTAPVNYTGKAWAIERCLEYVADGISYFGKKTKNIDVDKITKYTESVEKITKNILGAWKEEYATNAVSLHDSMSQFVSSFNGANKKYAKYARVTKNLFKELSNPKLSNANTTIKRLSGFIDKINSIDQNKVNVFVNLMNAFNTNKGLNNIFGSIRKQAKETKADKTIDKLIRKVRKIYKLFKSMDNLSKTGGVQQLSSNVENAFGGLLKQIKEFNDNGEVDKLVEEFNKLKTALLVKEKGMNSKKARAIRNSLWYIGSGLKTYNDITSQIDMAKVNEHIQLTNTITKDVIAAWKTEYKDNAEQINHSFNQLVTSFNGAGRGYKSMVKATTKMFKQMSSPNFVAANKTLSRASTFVNRVNAVDIEKASSLTDMFKSFASIGKGGNIFSNFDKRVKQFTEACIELVNAINGNTEAINNSEEEVVVKNEFGEEETVKRKDAELMPKQMTLLNIDELAMAIADHLNSLNVDCDANVNLMINGESSNEWRISRM